MIIYVILEMMNGDLSAIDGPVQYDQLQARNMQMHTFITGKRCSKL